MKAITLYEPYATLVALQEKKFETRPRNLHYRGVLAIHAAKTIPDRAMRVLRSGPCLATLKRRGIRIGPLARPDLWLPLGRVVAVCELIETFPITESETRAFVPVPGVAAFEIKVVIPPPLPERQWGDYTPGRYAYMLFNIKKLPEPIPARGLQGLWEWTPPDGFSI